MQNFFTAIAATLILCGTTYASPQGVPTLISKTLYQTAQTVPPADVCPEGTMGDDAIRALGKTSGLEVGAALLIEKDGFPAFLMVIEQIAPPPPGTAGFKIFGVVNGAGEKSVFISAQDANGCSLGGLRMSLDFFRQILEAATGRGA